MKTSRRTLLFFGGAAGLLAVFGGYKFLRGDPKEIIVAILQRRVGYLRVDPKTFDAFAEQYVKNQRQYERQLGHLSAVAWPMRYFTPYEWFKQGTPIRRLEDNVVSNYLLSTDFFQNGADESRQVEYVAYYDPGIAACRHPWARPAMGV